MCWLEKGAAAGNADAQIALQLMIELKERSACNDAPLCRCACCGQLMTDCAEDLPTEEKEEVESGEEESEEENEEVESGEEETENGEVESGEEETEEEIEDEVDDAHQKWLRHLEESSYTLFNQANSYSETELKSDQCLQLFMGLLDNLMEAAKEGHTFAMA